MNSKNNHTHQVNAARPKGHKEDHAPGRRSEEHGMVESRFRPSWWLPGGHGQTLWPTLMRRVRVNVRSERLELPDGDFLRLDWVGADGPIVIVLPGLQGDLGSAYVRGMLRACQSRGWRGVLLNYRGHGEPNRLRRSYHCGMTSDLDYLVQHLARRAPHTALGVVGYSVGANICLKWLGECGQRGQATPVAAAVGVSAPFHLGAVAKKIERGFSRVYQWYLLRSLRNDVRRKQVAIGDDLGVTSQELRRLNTFFKFDDRISGPLHGFNGAEDYYARTRSDVLLRHVQVPTLIVNAHNDPFVPAHLIPHPRDVSDKVTLEITRGGGHVGFVTGRWPWWPRFWLETRVPEFLARFL
jgi:predicted alpha/beta-fold hydrolase